jgi:prepilin peptidase CpaA
MTPDVLVALPATAAFVGLLLYAAVSDIASMTIPNWVSAAAAALFFPAAAAIGMPAAEIGVHIGAGVLVFVIGFGLFAAGVMGGGDVKVIAAASLWTGFGALGAFAFWTALAGGGLAIVMLAVRKLAAPAGERPAFVNRLLSPQSGIPYAVAIAVGALVTIGAQPIPRSFW